MVVTSLISIIVIGFLDWSWARNQVKENTFNQLTSVRAAKGYQLESYFKTLQNQIETLCEDRRVVEAMEGFKDAYGQLQGQSIPQDWLQDLETYYQSDFFPPLAEVIAGTPSFSTYGPDSSAAQYLQYYYIAANPNPVGAKDALLQAEDSSAYSTLHAQYHPLFRDLAAQYGYQDFFLIDYETDQVVYSVAKQVDYGTSLSRGPYQESNLAKVVQQVRENPDRDAIQIADFEGYRPSYLAPAAFFAGPIYDKQKLVGILAAKISVDEINQVMTGGQDWKQDGLGNSGETYVVGSDRLMRSLSRFLIEDPEDYIEALRSTGTPSSTIDAIEHLQTSILLQKVDTDVAKAAISGAEGIETTADYRGVPVFVSYGPLHIPGLDWALLAQIDVGEAYTPVQVLTTYLFIATVALILIVTLVANVAAYGFVKPINLLMEVAQDHEIDDEEKEILMQSKDEFSAIASILIGMSEAIQEQETLVIQRNNTVEQLLGYLVPSRIAGQLKQDEANLLENLKTVTDEIQNVSIMVVTFVGLSHLAIGQPVETVAGQLNEMVDNLDAIGEKTDIERLNTVGDRYIAICGLTRPHLDHEKRIVDFALEALNLIPSFNTRHNTALGLHIGVHSGSIMSGVIGTQKLSYNLWGETLTTAIELSIQAADNTLLVTQEIYDRLQDLYQFVESKTVEVGEVGSISTWSLQSGVVSED
jgi:class 3 adenylate cyclase